MGFFDNLGKKASEAYGATAKKTGDLAKEAKLRMKINENKSDINELYTEIGKKVYEKYVSEETFNMRYVEEECSKIDILSSEIESCLTSILELKNRKQCPKCFAEIDANATFCPKCGAKQDDFEAKEVEIVDNQENNSDEQHTSSENSNVNQENNN